MLITNIILSIFLLVATGYLLGYFKLVPVESAGPLMLYVFWAAVPAIVFSTISEYQLPEIFVWRFWVAYLLGILIITLVCYSIFRYFFSGTNQMSAIIAGFSATAKNTIMIGLPVLIGITGKKAVIPMAITVIVFSCFIVPIIMFLFEINLHKEKNHAHAEGHILINSLVATLKNPQVIAAILGLIFSAFQIPLPKFLKTLFEYFGQSIIPCALFAIGLSLVNTSIKGNIAKSLTVTFINLFICPCFAILLSYLLNLSPFYAVALVIFSSVPTAKIMYIYASKYHFFEQETATIISLTTIFSVLTIPLFIYISSLLWPVVFHH